MTVNSMTVSPWPVTSFVITVDALAEFKLSLFFPPVLDKLDIYGKDVVWNSVLYFAWQTLQPSEVHLLATWIVERRHNLYKVCANGPLRFFEELEVLENPCSSTLSVLRYSTALGFDGGSTCCLMLEILLSGDVFWIRDITRFASDFKHIWYRYVIKSKSYFNIGNSLPVSKDCHSRNVSASIFEHRTCIKMSS